MQLSISDHDTCRIITADEPRLDAAAAIQFKESFRQACAGETPRVVLDLSAVEFLDSSGLGAVVSCLKLLEPPRRLELAGLTQPVARVFRLTRMDTIFTIHPNAAEALAGCGHGV